MTLRLEDVGKRYGRRGHWVLRDVTLAIPPASVTAVAGANGSGKSTLLRVVAGLAPPTRGSIVNRPARVAVVPDRFAPPDVTGRTYLEHLGRVRGLGAATRRRRIGELVERLAIVPGLEVPMRKLSRGNAKKVALAQAFMAEADLLVLDEPRAALDDEALLASTS